MSAIYLDNAATTPIDPEVWEALSPFYAAEFGNPSSRYGLGVRAAEAIDRARSQIARVVGADARDVTFVSGGTEANNMAVLGIGRKVRAGRILIGASEHPSVREAARTLTALGHEVIEVPLTADGELNLEAYAQLLNPDTRLVAQMLVNNEVGSIYSVGKLTRRVRRLAPDAHVHVDAVQGLGKVDVSLSELGCDSIALSAHKLHAPKGSGCLVTRSEIQIEPLLFGGGQEGARRSGTENVAGNVGLGAAVSIAQRELANAQLRTQQCRDMLLSGLADLSGARALFTGAKPQRTAAVVAVELPGPPAEVWLHHLEQEGVLVSAGSACQANKGSVSHALLAHGLNAERAKHVLRFSFARSTQLAEVEAAVAALGRVFAKLAVLES